MVSFMACELCLNLKTPSCLKWNKTNPQAPSSSCPLAYTRISPARMESRPYSSVVPRARTCEQALEPQQWPKQHVNPGHTSCFAKPSSWPRPRVTAVSQAGPLRPRVRVDVLKPDNKLEAEVGRGAQPPQGSQRQPRVGMGRGAQPCRQLWLLFPVSRPPDSAGLRTESTCWICP